jgi:hypothetical protein
MFLKDTTRFKHGKEHRYCSLVENRRVDGGRKVVQRHVPLDRPVNLLYPAAPRLDSELQAS